MWRSLACEPDGHGAVAPLVGAEGVDDGLAVAGGGRAVDVDDDGGAGGRRPDAGHPHGLAVGKTRSPPLNATSSGPRSPTHAMPGGADSVPDANPGTHDGIDGMLSFTEKFRDTRLDSQSYSDLAALAALSNRLRRSGRPGTFTFRLPSFLSQSIAVFAADVAPSKNDCTRMMPRCNATNDNPPSLVTAAMACLAARIVP